MKKTGELLVSSEVSVDTGKSIVKIAGWGEDLCVSADDAEAIGVAVLRAAERARCDKAVFDALADAMGMTVAAAASPLAIVRDRRAKQ